MNANASFNDLSSREWMAPTSDVQTGGQNVALAEAMAQTRNRLRVHEISAIP
jgi:hypothetical protein